MTPDMRFKIERFCYKSWLIDDNLNKTINKAKSLEGAKKHILEKYQENATQIRGRISSNSFEPHGSGKDE